jgi:antitoxin component YwqK of YwqJK toxin-antitoxin module
MLKIITSEKTIELNIDKQSKHEVIASNPEYLYQGDYKGDYANGKGVFLYKIRNDYKVKFLEGVFRKGFLVKGCIYNLKFQRKAYEGTFKNGKLYGKGKEYGGSDDDFYEGTYKDGKLNGKGIEVYDGVVRYRGGFKDNMYFGKGIDYNEHGKKIYEGYFEDGCRDGKGKEYNEDGQLIYEGNFQLNFYEGKGKKYHMEGRGFHVARHCSIGSFKSGRKDGKIMEYNQDGKLVGVYMFQQGRRNGKTTTYYPDGKIKSKENFKNNRRTGKFREYYTDGKIKEDTTWNTNGRKGKKYDKRGFCEEGQFTMHGKEGPFKIYFPNGKLYQKGSFVRDYQNGLFSIYYHDGKLSFKGTFRDGQKEGKGTQYYADGTKKYVGNYEYGRYSGDGKEYDEDGKLIKEGKFSNGNLSKGTMYYEDGNYIKGNFEYGKPTSLCSIYGPDKKIREKGYFKDGKKNGEVRMYHKNGKVEFKGMFVKDKKDGPGTEYNEQGKIARKGFWKDGKYEGKKNPSVSKVSALVEENNIKKFLQTNDKKFLKKLQPDSIKNYLKKYARKQVKGTKPKLVKQLELWRKEIKETPRESTTSGPTVFDAYEGGDVPIKEFLEEDDRVLLLDDKGHYYGAYLEQCEIVYECQTGRSWRNYIGKDDVHSMIQFNTASGPKFYFTTDIDKELKKGYNLFHFKTEPKNIRVLSKNVAGGGSIVSGLHCDPKDVVKLSKVIKKQKMGKGLKKTIKFTF